MYPKFKVGGWCALDGVHTKVNPARKVYYTLHHPMQMDPIPLITLSMENDSISITISRNTKFEEGGGLQPLPSNLVPLLLIMEFETKLT